MLDQLTNEQLLSHLIGIGQITRTRAQELKYFTDNLPAKLAEAMGDPQKESSLRYGLDTYLSNLEELLKRGRQAQAEIERRIPAKV